MAYLYRVIAGAALSLFWAVSVAQTCPANTLVFANYPGSDNVCRSGCFYVFDGHDEESPDSGWIFSTTGAVCDSNESEGGGNPPSGENPEIPIIPGIPDMPGIPENAVFCGEKDYKHDCYDEDGDYWYNDDYEHVCNHEEDKNDWHKCYFDGKYYRKVGFRVENEWDSYNDYRYNRCKYDHDVDSSTEDYMEATSKWYCIERYRGTDESVLYEQAKADFRNDKTASDILFNEEIDISQKFGIIKNPDGSISSEMNDLLEGYRPNKSGAYGVCLSDIEIEIEGEIVVLEISRVCEWLEILGQILVVVSFLISINILIRD